MYYNCLYRTPFNKLKYIVYKIENTYKSVLNFTVTIYSIQIIKMD